MTVMIGCDELGEVSVVHPVAVGGEPRAQCPEEEQQDA